jgi:hypothetical protein
MLAIKASNHLICMKNVAILSFCIQGISLEANTLLHKHKVIHNF